MTATTFLRPIHAWFFTWERIVPSIYRVVAVLIAAAITVAVLAVFDVHALLAVVVSLAAWIGLAIAQEHDQRVFLEPDPDFARALAAETGREPLSLHLDHARGPSRSRRGSSDVFVLSTDAGEAHPLSGRLVQIHRSRLDQEMRLDVFGDRVSDRVESIERRLLELGAAELAGRVQRAEAPTTDVEAIIAALRTAYF